MIRLSAMRVSTSDRMNNLPMTAGEGEVIIAGGGALNATSQLPERGNHQNVTKTKTKKKRYSSLHALVLPKKIGFSFGDHLAPFIC